MEDDLFTRTMEADTGNCLAYFILECIQHEGYAGVVHEISQTSLRLQMVVEAEWLRKDLCVLVVPHLPGSNPSRGRYVLANFDQSIAGSPVKHSAVLYYSSLTWERYD